MSDKQDPPRWSGPPEGPPDYIRPMGSGCSTSLLIIVGLASALVGLGALAYGVNVANWTLGPNFPFFVAGLVAGGCGIILTVIARLRSFAHAKAQRQASADLPPPKRNGCLYAGGLLLLLPGVVAVAAGSIMAARGSYGTAFLVGLPVGLFGIHLLRMAWLRYVRGNDDDPYLPANR